MMQNVFCSRTVTAPTFQQQLSDVFSTRTYRLHYSLSECMSYHVCVCVCVSVSVNVTVSVNVNQKLLTWLK